MNFLQKATKAFIRGFNESDQPKTEEKINYAISKVKREMQDDSVNHILHLILSIITAGLWIPIWIIIVLFSHTDRYSSENKLKELSREREQVITKIKQNNHETIKDEPLNKKTSLSEELVTISKLKKDGMLSDEEYKVAKMKVLSSNYDS